MTLTRLLIAASAVGFTIASAQAQTPNQLATNGSQIGEHAHKANKGSSTADPNKQKADDKAYNAALKNLPDKQYDPWHGVR